MAQLESTDRTTGGNTLRTGASAFATTLVISVLAAGTTWLLARHWAPALSAFGAHLSSSASLALAISPWLLVLPAVIALAWALAPRPGQGLAVGVCALIILLAIASITAMYLPLFSWRRCCRSIDPAAVTIRSTALRRGGRRGGARRRISVVEL